MGDPFDVEALLRLPRRGGLALAPDGERLVVGAAALDGKGAKYTSSLWQADPAGVHPSRRLTFSAEGEMDATFLADGSLLFVSERPAGADPAEGPVRMGIWHLPEHGEARLLRRPPGGVVAPSAGTAARTLAAAREAHRVAYVIAAFPGAPDDAADRAHEAARETSGTTAILYETYPIRYWDHWFGPRERRLVVADVDPQRGELREVLTLAPEADNPLAMEEVSFDLTPDGKTLVTGWRDASEFTVRRTDLVAVEVGTGARRVLATDPGADFEDVRCAPDGRHVACVRHTHGEPARAEATALCVVELATGELRDLTRAQELDIAEHTWGAGGDCLYFTASKDGRMPLFKVTLADGVVTRLSDDGHFSDVCPATDGRVFALRSRMESPPEVVAVPADGHADQVVALHPDEGSASHGQVEEGWAKADDGQPIHYWLFLPPGASSAAPAPLLTFVHGGPRSSWNGWQWRWSAAVMAAAGYAVVLPDPALSLGYGQDFVQRGWGAWGERPFADILATIDAACARDDVDADRVALMGGSYGGYMANWTAGHTGRFKAIVTHASLWDLDQFAGTTDDALWMEWEFGDPWVDASRFRENNPSAGAPRIQTPMLVIHGDRDYRVPVTEGIRLWVELRRRGVEAKFLFFPNENHWILNPGNIRAWYQTVQAFLDQHVKGEPWRRPELL